MKLDKNKKILIVGLGLMGGSYAKALSRKGYEVKAIARRQETLDYALEHGLIKEGFLEADKEILSWPDIIVFALYPHIFIKWMEENGSLLKKGTILTDVTGVKSEVVYRIQEMLPEGIEFIGSHPMAGREVYGVENADDGIFEKANYIVTPTDRNTREAVETSKDLGWTLGFKRVVELSPEMHDDMIAYLSQLTHCIAVSLMTCNSNENIAEYTGDSFRDLTRIANINEDMWSELFILNKKALSKEMRAFESEIHRMRIAVEENDTETLKEMMRLSTKRRKIFNKKEEEGEEKQS